MTLDQPIHPDLGAAQELLYKPHGLICQDVLSEKESQEYGACSFKLNGKKVQFRVTKITPTKIGQFVTLWKRIGNGPIMPYDMSDPVDVFIVTVRTCEHFGQFIFSKELYNKKDMYRSMAREASEQCGFTPHGIIRITHKQKRRKSGSCRILWISTIKVMLLLLCCSSNHLDYFD